MEKKYDDIFRLDDSWEKISSIIAFGYGRVGKRTLPKLEEMFHIPFIIDNNPKYKLYNEKKILNIDDGLAKRVDEKIVVLTVGTAYTLIKKELEKRGLKEYKDFCILERFFEEWYLRYAGKCYLSKIDTILTSRCTLACPHCAMFIPYCSQKEDYSLKDIKNNFDTMFKVVDYILEYTLLGGEPIIHRDIVEILTYLYEKYGDKIGRIVLITNGAVNPSVSVYKALKTCNAILSISDYTNVYSYNEKLKNFIQNLEKYEIPYYFNVEMEWKDHGYPEKPRNFHDDIMKEHLEACGHTTHSINSGILYYCDAMFGAENNVGYSTQPDDILDLDSLIKIKDLLEIKYDIFSYCMGNVGEKGFPSFCKKCAGIGHDNQDVIPAGM